MSTFATMAFVWCQQVGGSCVPDPLARALELSVYEIFLDSKGNRGKGKVMVTLALIQSAAPFATKSTGEVKRTSVGRDVLICDRAIEYAVPVAMSI